MMGMVRACVRACVCVCVCVLSGDEGGGRIRLFFLGQGTSGNERTYTCHKGQ